MHLVVGLFWHIVHVLTILIWEIVVATKEFSFFTCTCHTDTPILNMGHSTIYYLRKCRTVFAKQLQKLYSSLQFYHVVIYTLALRRALADGKADVAYCRVMLLGPAGVGKTSFRRGLMGETFNPDSDSTTMADVSHVTSVISREWIRHDVMNKWCEVSTEDEIDELSKLMKIVERSRSGQPHKTSSLSYQISRNTNLSYRMSLQSEYRFERLKQLMESEIIKKAMAKAKKMNEVNTSLIQCQPFFHLWDCGGQPVFLEVLPIFLTCRTMFLMFFDASKDLKEQWKSVFFHNGEETAPEVLNCTTL